MGCYHEMQCQVKYRKKGSLWDPKQTKGNPVLVQGVLVATPWLVMRKITARDQTSKYETKQIYS